MTLVFVGTSANLQILTSPSRKVRPAIEVALQGEWITSILPDSWTDQPSILATTRSGKIFRWTPLGVSLVAEVPYRLWFITRSNDGRLVAGGSSNSLFWMSPRLSYHRFECIHIASMWRSHSGEAAHINAYLDVGEQHSCIAVEVGGVASKTSHGWTSWSRGLDPDVHKLVRRGINGCTLLAATGTGIFQLQTGTSEWKRLRTPRLPYVQGILSRHGDGTIFISAAAAPFGRHLTGEFSGVSRKNRFGIFYGDGVKPWKGIPMEGIEPAGILSKALAFGSESGDIILAGDLKGRLLESRDGGSFQEIARDLGMVECVEVVHSTGE